jgi:hypothetical protein
MARVVTSSFEQWRSDDQRWLKDHLPFLGEVFQWFLKHYEWPEVGPLQHAIYQTGDRTTDVREIANARPTIPGQFALAVKPTIPLGARHLLRIPEARTLLTVTVAATQQAVAKFLAAVPGQQVSLSRSEIQLATPGQRSTLKLLPNFVTSDQPTFGGGGGDEEWVLGIYSDLVMEFEGVKDPSDYVDRQLHIIRGWCDQYDARAGLTQSGGPYRAFIVMPFEKPWSDAVHSFIRRAIEAFDGNVVPIRADEIAAPGKITNQIVEELASCDLVVADITGNNANVAWELGYAFAHDKPCAILRSKKARGRAPFDIYDHRRTDYSPEPTADEEQRLIRSIEAAIDLLRSVAERVDVGAIFK